MINIAGIEKEEFQLPNNEKLVVEYGIYQMDGPVPDKLNDLMDLRMAPVRQLSLFDETGKLIGTKIEENPHQVKAPPGIVY